MIRLMKDFYIVQKDSDINGELFIQAFNDRFICDVEYSDYFKEESDFLKIFEIMSEQEYLPIAVFVHLVNWVYPPLFPYAMALFSNNIINRCMQAEIKIESLEYAIDHISDLLIKTQSVANQNTYLIKDSSSGLIKIGKSKDVLQRINSLSVGNPNLKLVMEIAQDVENKLHIEYDKKRVKREWFSLSDDDLIDIHNKYQPKVLA